MKKEFLNSRIDEDNNITIKLVRMGMDIDKDNNHRVRGIIPTDKGHHVFVEILLARRPSISLFNNKEDKERYNTIYPYPEYIHMDSCFRVDDPIDYYENSSKEYRNFDRKPFYNMEYNKASIIKVLNKLNSKITDIELVDYNYIDEFCDSKKFYRLYDDRLDHEYKPIKINCIYDNYYRMDFEYRCKHKNWKDDYIKVFNREVSKNQLADLKNKYGEKIIDNLMDDYKNRMKWLHEKLEK